MLHAENRWNHPHYHIPVVTVQISEIAAIVIDDHLEVFEEDYDETDADGQRIHAIYGGGNVNNPSW